MVAISDKNNSLEPAAWLYEVGTGKHYFVTREKLGRGVDDYWVPLVRADHLPLEELINHLAIAHRQLMTLKGSGLEKMGGDLVDEVIEENRELQDRLERLLWEVSQDG